MSSKPRESKATEGREGTVDLPERWSAGRKEEIVLRLLRGEDVGEARQRVSPATGRRYPHGGLIRPPTCPRNRDRFRPTKMKVNS